LTLVKPAVRRSAATPAVGNVMHPDPIQAARIQTRYFVAMFRIVLASLLARGIRFTSSTILLI